MKHLVKLLSFIFLFIIVTSFASAIGPGPVNPYSFSATPGTKPGTVNITWYDDGSLSTNYNLYYGTSLNTYPYSVANIPHGTVQTNQFLVEALTPNQTYYFKLDGVSGGSYFTSGPVMTKASSGKKTVTNSSYNFYLSYGKSGTVNVNWFDNGTANKYDIVYGTHPDGYQFGAYDIVYQRNKNNTFPVNFLVPGKTYYFALVAERDGKTVLWSQPLTITAR